MIGHIHRSLIAVSFNTQQAQSASQSPTNCQPEDMTSASEEVRCLRPDGTTEDHEKHSALHWLLPIELRLIILEALTEKDLKSMMIADPVGLSEIDTFQRHTDSRPLSPLSSLAIRFCHAPSGKCRHRATSWSHSSICWKKQRVAIAFAVCWRNGRSCPQISVRRRPKTSA